MRYAVLESPLGTILLFARNDSLSELDIIQEGAGEAREIAAGRYPGADEAHESFEETAGLLRRYMRGDSVDIDIPLDLTGLRPFTRRVLLEVKKVPYGEVASYGAIAERVGSPGAARAVGQAVGRNPVPIVIPCHRIVQADGSLGGFGMGLELKRRLLAIEGVKLCEPRKR
jgi:methylated-DNA-[protein]-cysteine S-methyltransferase